MNKKEKAPLPKQQGLMGIKTHGDSLRESRCVYPIIK